MKLTSEEIQNKQFRVRFRGFDIQEVDGFLEEVALMFHSLENDMRSMDERIKQLESENSAYREREGALKETLIHSQKVIEQMRENARKAANNIIAAAELKAEKILSNAHGRLAQLHTEISELKQQRMQIEIQLQSTLEGHIKLLENAKIERQLKEEEDEKVKLLKQTKASG